MKHNCPSPSFEKSLNVYSIVKIMTGMLGDDEKGYCLRNEEEIIYCPFCGKKLK